MKEKMKERDDGKAKLLRTKMRERVSQ